MVRPAQSLSNAKVSMSTEPAKIEDANDKVESYDLTQSRNMSGGMPGLEIIGERFAASFKRTLATTLRQACDIQALSIELITFRDFILQVPRPTGLFVFQLPPLPGGCAVVIDGHLLLSLVDAFCGGPETKLDNSEAPIERELTKIELTLLNRLAKPMLSNLAHAWEPILPLEPDFSQIVIRPELSRLADEPETVIFAVFEIVLGKFRSPMGIILPMSTIEPVRERLMRVSHVPGHVRSSQPGQRLIEHLPEINLDLDIELGRTSIDVRTLLALKEGDILRLENRSDQPILATIEGKPKFRGTPESSGSAMTFQITDIIDPK